MAFNKGPWKLCDSGIDVNCEAGIIATCDDPNTNQHFNACLIAAAPEMYEALKAYLQWFDDDSKSNERVKQWLDEIGIPAMRAALLKAEGREG